MAFGTQLFTISAVAVSVAACLAGNLRLQNEDRSSACTDFSKDDIRKEQKIEIQGRRALQQARFAPEFDGLHCFETIVAR